MFAHLSRAGGLSTEAMIAHLRERGFAPSVLASRGGTLRVTAEELEALRGALDVIWLRSERASPELMRAMNEHPRGALTLQAIAAENMRMMKPI